MENSQALPTVSYVMPVLNEVTTLEAAVSRVLAQEYPVATELVLALAPSQDGTDALATRLAEHNPQIRIVENPERDIPIGLNLAIEASAHEVIVRVDAHSELSDGYTLTAVRSLLAHNAANVGGIMYAAGSTPIGRAIARGYNSPFGLGGGTYHTEGDPKEAESAYLGVFWKSAWRAVGGFDEGVRRGEDWEFNLRLRKAGYRVWFDPTLRVTYRPRESWRALRQQFFATGVWRAVITKRVPRETPIRFFIPGTLVTGLVLACVFAALAVSRVLPRWCSGALLLPLGYLAGIIFGALRMPEKQSLSDRLRSIRALAAMHLSWGTGFIWGVLRGGSKTVDRSRAN